MAAQIPLRRRSPGWVLVFSEEGDDEGCREGRQRGRQRGVFLMMIEEDLLAAVQGTIAKEEEDDCYVLRNQDSGRPRRGIRQAGTCVPSRAAKRRVNPRISRGDYVGCRGGRDARVLRQRLQQRDRSSELGCAISGPLSSNGRHRVLTIDVTAAVQEHGVAGLRVAMDSLPAAIISSKVVAGRSGTNGSASALFIPLPQRRFNY